MRSTSTLSSLYKKRRRSPLNVYPTSFSVVNVKLRAAPSAYKIPLVRFSGPITTPITRAASGLDSFWHDVNGKRGRSIMRANIRWSILSFREKILCWVALFAKLNLVLAIHSFQSLRSCTDPCRMSTAPLAFEPRHFEVGMRKD